MKKVCLLCLALLLLTLTGCAAKDLGATVTPPLSSPSATTAVPSGTLVSLSPSPAPNEVLVHDTRYGFDFVLPESWQGYTTLETTWEGVAASGEEAGKVVETGPEITIRHPKWTQAEQRQDIPILIFSLEQWSDLQNEVFHIGAAPIGPSELGRNSRFVFAIPARYNFAFPVGYEEVEEILKGQPLRPTEEFSVP